jgi:hypothetical protein
MEYKMGQLEGKNNNVIGANVIATEILLNWAILLLPLGGVESVQAQPEACYLNCSMCSLQRVVGVQKPWNT